MILNVTKDNIVRKIEELGYKGPIILMGCDGAGKSTIAKNLQENLYKNDDSVNYVIKRDGHAKFPLEAIEASKEVFERAGENIIWDRVAMIDVLIYYLTLYDNASMEEDARFFNEKESEEFKNKLRNILIDNLVIYVHAPKDVIRKRLDTRGDEFYEQLYDNVEKILNEYKDHIHYWNSQFYERGNVFMLSVNTDEKWDEIDIIMRDAQWIKS